MYLSRLSQPQKLAFYALAHAIAAADAGVASDERVLLNAILGEMGIGEPAELATVPAACAAFSSPAERRIVLLELFLIALVDGDIAGAELDLIREVSRLLGVEGDLRRAQDWANAMLQLHRSAERFIQRPA